MPQIQDFLTPPNSVEIPVEKEQQSQKVQPSETGEEEKEETENAELLQELKTSLDSITQRIDELQVQVKEPVVIKEPEQEEEWKPKKWKDIVEKAREVSREEFASMTEAEKDNYREQLQQEETLKKQIDQEFDNTLKTLEREMKIPKVANTKDPNDPGRQARKEILGLGIRYNSIDLRAMNDLREALNTSGYHFDSVTNQLVKESGSGNKVPFGQSAPVGSSAKSHSAGKGPDYKTIHNLSMDELVRRFNNG